ncbi:MAG: cyclic nucleotide-binding domain-containing protein [Rhodospirillales bacterium]
MSSVITYQGKIYLIDAGPNLMSVLNGLGINVNEIEGIFHTHGHDDHFAGLTTLMRTDHRIKYFATPLVRESVTKKFCALVSIPEADFKTYFNIQDLEFNEWSNIDGLEVRPVFSPHPVETSIFYFRALGDDGYRTYGHLADIAAFDVLDDMVADGNGGGGVSKELVERTKAEYLTPVDVKKIDIGGGLIHGQAKDFASDQSKKLILSHIDREFTQDEKEIGEGAPYGTIDQLIPTYQDYVRRAAYEFVTDHFSQIPEYELRTLLNRPIETFNPETTLLRAGDIPENIYLVLTGNVEFVDAQYHLEGDLTAGSFLGELPAIEHRPSHRTYRAKSFVKALSFPIKLYIDLVERHGLMLEMANLIQRRYFLQRTRLFGDSVSSPVQERLAGAMTERHLKKGDELSKDNIRSLLLVKEGTLARTRDGKKIETLGEGDVIGVVLAMGQVRGQTVFVAEGPCELYEIPILAIQNIPTVRWKLFESFRHRQGMLGLSAKTT